MPGRRRLVGLAALIAAVAIAVVAFVAFTRDDGSRIVVPPNSVAVVDPATNDVVAAIQVGIRPGPITAGDGALWVGNLDDRNLTRIDARSQRPAGTVSLDGRTPTGLTFDRGTVWVAHGLLGSVSLVDAQFGNVASVTPVTRRGVYSSAGSVAGGSRGDLGGVRRRHPGAARSRDRAVAERTTTDGSPVGVTAGYGSVWIASAFQSSVQRFSPLSLAAVDRSTVSSRPSAIVAGFGDVWVTSAAADLVHRIDIGGGSIRATIEVGDGPSAIAVGGDSVWVANTASRTVSRIDPETNTEIEEIEVGQAPAGLVAAGNLIWVTVQER